MPLHPSRRKFVQDAGLASIALSLSPQFIKAQSSAKKDIIKIGVIGTGFRGQNHIELLVQRPDVVVVAFADPDEKMLADAQNILKKAGKTAAIEYKNGKEDYKNLLKRTDIDAVIIANPKGDLFNPNIVRSSVGCLFTNQIATGTTSEIIAFLKERKINFYCATLQNSTSYHTQDYTMPSALVVGTEATGLSQEWREAATQNIIIPMQGEIDSMNVSVAAAILIFEAKRQRGF